MKEQMNFVSCLDRQRKLYFGVGTIHHLPFRRERNAILQQALDIGFRCFDVAPAYGNGVNELELGEALKGLRSECSISTKFGIPSDLYGARHPGLFFLIRGFKRVFDARYNEEYKRRVFNSFEMVRSLEESLKRLRTDYIDNFLIHEPLSVVTDVELMDMHDKASRMKEQGKILRWGVAGPWRSIAQFRGDLLMDVFQFPLDEVSQTNCSPLCERIAYGAYRAYVRTYSDGGLTFSDFVKNEIDKSNLNIIVATKSMRTLGSFRDFF